ncbi:MULTISPECIES: CopG family ribbon-helix-helix protein [Erwinia]|uniref:CopG family ribbon-helix-helix protein n=1 Tax=Erwinia TaxID=551 RepID=UPI00209DE5CD|nr:ribbon-helix-helix domain-containing protein [Erwinia aphidicola]MCP2231053.1 putative transcriptional regulator [Erwinia aphidicola]
MIKIESFYEASVMGQSNTRVVTAHLSIEMAEKLDLLATSYDRSRGGVVKQAIQAMIDQEERRHQMTLEALAAVDEGRVVAHDDVMKWANSLSTDSPLALPKAGRK